MRQLAMSSVRRSKRFSSPRSLRVCEDIELGRVASFNAPVWPGRFAP